jgi:spermidine synthase
MSLMATLSAYFCRYPRHEKLHKAQAKTEGRRFRRLFSLPHINNDSFLQYFDLSSVGEMLSKMALRMSRSQRLIVVIGISSCFFLAEISSICHLSRLKDPGI